MRLRLVLRTPPLPSRDVPATRSIPLHVQAQDFSRFGLGDDFKWAAANLAIRCEALGGNAGVNGQVKGLAAERALNDLGNLHEPIYDSLKIRKIWKICLIRWLRHPILRALLERM